MPHKNIPGGWFALSFHQARINNLREGIQRLNILATSKQPLLAIVAAL
jgi:hypothetical protein